MQRFQSSSEQTFTTDSDDCHTCGDNRRYLKHTDVAVIPNFCMQTSFLFTYVRNEPKLSYWFSREQRKDAQSLLSQVAVGLHAVPVGELKSQQVPAVLRAHCLRQQQGQTVVSCRQMAHQQLFNSIKSE